MDQPTAVIGDKPCPFCDSRPGRSHIPACPEFRRILRENQARTATDAKLGELARICFAGTYQTSLDRTRFEMTGIETQLTFVLRLAAAGKVKDGIDTLLVAEAFFPWPELEADVDRIREILATL